MNLGLDIDGVMTDIESFQFKYGIPFFKEKYGKNVKNENGKNIRQIFECEEEEERAFWSKYLFYYAFREPIRERVSAYTKWAYENGHKVYIITSRVFTTQKSVLGAVMRFAVKRWLRVNKVKYDKIIFCDEEKVQAIKEYKIHYMVEDDPDNIMSMKELTNVICMDAKCNVHIRDREVKRCHNFEEILAWVSENQSNNN